MLVPHSPTQNLLLAALSPEEMERLAPQLELVAMRLGDVIYRPGEHLQYCYFPTTAIVSLHYVTESGTSTEISAVGNDGVVGISVFMGGETTPSSATVQIAGHGYRLGSRVLKQEFTRAGSMHYFLLRYTQALMTQVSQNGACNRHHSIGPKLCSWLLVTLDRMTTQELVITQELIASILGVRREGITEAAGNLQRAGFISYRRGHISVLDRTGLETQACECYTVVRKEVNRLRSRVYGMHSKGASN